MAEVFQRCQQCGKYSRCYGLPSADHLDSRRIWRCVKQSNTHQVGSAMSFAALISILSWRSNCPKARKYCRSPVDSKPSTW